MYPSEDLYPIKDPQDDAEEDDKCHLEDTHGTTIPLCKSRHAKIFTISLWRTDCIECIQIVTQMLNNRIVDIFDKEFAAEEAAENAAAAAIAAMKQSGVTDEDSNDIDYGGS